MDQSSLHKFILAQWGCSRLKKVVVEPATILTGVWGQGIGVAWGVRRIEETHGWSSAHGHCWLHQLDLWGGGGDFWLLGECPAALYQLVLQLPIGRTPENYEIPECSLFRLCLSFRFENSEVAACNWTFHYSASQGRRSFQPTAVERWWLFQGVR